MAVYDETTEFDTDLFYIDTVAHNKKRSIGILVFRNGDESAIFDSGMPNSTQNIVSAFEDFGITNTSIRYIMLSHRHIDHAGAASVLLRQFPHAIIAVHPFSAKHLVDPSKIYEGGRELFGDYATPMNSVPVASIHELQDNESIHVGKEIIKAIYAPGHTSDHIAYYIPSRRVLYSGDAIGAYDTRRGRVYPTCMYPSFDYEKYQKTLSRISQLDFDKVVFPHFGAVSGKGAKQSLKDSLSIHRELERVVEEYVGENNEEKIIGELKYALRDATEIFPESVREKAAEYMARGFFEGSRTPRSSSVNRSSDSI